MNIMIIVNHLSKKSDVDDLDLFSELKVLRE